jgi:hypothetical protein
MNRTVFLVALAALLETGAASQSPIAPDRPPSVLRIASFHAGPARCGAFEKAPVRAIAPLPVASALAEPGDPIRFGFRIDQEGRPLSIRQIGGPEYPALDMRDLAPALTAWRFEPGAAQTDCEIAFTVRLDSVESADEALVYRYAALGRLQIPGSSGAALIGQAFVRLRRPGSTCTSDPVPREPINLQFQSIPEIPGGISYSFFSFDVDAEGRPAHIRLLDSSGNRPLDVAGDIAIGQARFPAQPRIGCLHYFFRNSRERVAAPVEPPSDFYPASAACADEIPRKVTMLFRLRYPVEFVRRPAEGWVVFTYDIARSGELGNIRILASEPAARFGEEVSRVAAEVRVSGVPRAQRGCVQRVRFVSPGR